MPDTIAFTLRALQTPDDADEAPFDTTLWKRTHTQADPDTSGLTSITVGTSEESITVPTDVGANAFFIYRNLDDTNIIRIGIATAVYFGRCQPRLFGLVQLDATPTIFLLALVADCRFQYGFLAE